MTLNSVTSAVIQDSTFIDIARDYNSYYVAGSLTVNKSDAIDLSPLLHTISSGAAFDSGDQASPCLPGTRKEVLQSISHWIDTGLDVKQGKLCWLHGPAGAGKTAVAYTIAKACAEKRLLAASYFFARDRPKRDAVHHFIPTLAYQLSVSIPELRPLILENFHKDPAVHSKHISAQFQTLLVEPLQSIATQTTPTGPSLIVIDGLDECEDVANQSTIMTHILKLLVEHSFPLRFLIASRPEPHIQETLISHHKISTVLSLDDLDQAKRDIEIYLKTEFAKIASSPSHASSLQRTSKPWPPHGAVKRLSERSGGCFIYASTSMKFIGDQNASPIDRLNTFLRRRAATPNAFAELDKLYTQILSSNSDPETLKRILGVILALRKQKGRFLHLSLIAQILRITPDTLSLALRGMHSLIYHDPTNLYSEVYPHHFSFSEFLFDQYRSKRFYIDVRRAHYEIIQGSLLCMKRRGERRSIFSMHYEHHGLLNYLYDHLMWHLQKAEGHLLEAIELIKEIRADVWIPADYKADHRFDDPDDASKIICLLANILHLVTSLGPPDGALADYFHTLLGVALQRLLVLKSDNERLTAHAIVTLYEEFDEPEHNSSSILRLLQLKQPVTPSLIFIHSIICGAIRRQSSPGATTSNLPTSGQLKEYLRDWLVDRAQSKELFLEPSTTHAHLAHGCMALLTAGPKDSDVEPRPGMKDRDSADTYARRHWAKHISHATPGDVDLLRHLRNIDRKFLFNEEYLESVSPDDDSFVQHFCGSSSTVGRSSRHSHQCWTAFRKQDYLKAKMVLDWLKQSPNPPSDLIKLWESYREEKEWYTELDTSSGAADEDEETSTIASHSDDSSYLRHFREWWRHFG